MDNKTLDNKLALVKDVKRFCVERLGIVDNDSFEKLDPCMRSVYVVHAVPEYGKIVSPGLWDSFTKIEEALLASIKFTINGYETYIRSAEAVGSEDMKITQMLMDSSPSKTIRVVLHENCHIQFNKNDVDIQDNINESVAKHLEFSGARIYCREQGISFSGFYSSEKKYANLFELTNNIVHKYNRHHSDKKLHDIPEISEDIKSLKRMIGSRMKLFIGNDNKITKAVLLDYYRYSRHHFHVKNVLDSIDPREYLERIVEYGRPIRSIPALKDAVRPKSYFCMPKVGEVIFTPDF